MAPAEPAPALVTGAEPSLAAAAVPGAAVVSPPLVSGGTVPTLATPTARALTATPDAVILAIHLVFTRSPFADRIV